MYELINPHPNGGARSWEPQSQMPNTFQCPTVDQTDGELLISTYWGIGGVPRDGETIGKADFFCGLAATNGTFFPDSKVRIAEIEDGTSNTIAIGERTYTFRAWMTGATWSGNSKKAICGEASNNLVYPINANHEQFGYYVGDNLRPDGTLADLPLNDLFFGSFHPGGANFALTDGSVQFLSEDIDLTVLKGMSTINGQEINRLGP